MLSYFYQRHPPRSITTLGFTIFELLIVIVLIGILAAISTPSFFSLINRKKVDDALNLVQGALKEAQREGMKKSHNCSITLDTENIVGGCLVTGKRDLGNVRYVHNDIPSNTITYDFRGNVALGGSDRVIVFYLNGNRSYQKCLVVTEGLGLIRIGNYPGNDTTTPAVSKCTTKQYQ